MMKKNKFRIILFFAVTIFFLFGLSFGMQIKIMNEIQEIKKGQIANTELIESMDYHVTEVSGYMSGHIGEIVTINNERVGVVK